MSRATTPPSIAAYGFIADGSSVALVSRAGSIDWCCMPRVDAGSIFGRLLDAERGGYCSLAPTEMSEPPFPTYLDGTLVLETTFRTAGGEARLLDCFSLDEDEGSPVEGRVLRIVEGKRGYVDFEAHIVPRFDYGDVRPWIRHDGVRLYSAIGGNDALVICSDAELDREGGHALCSAFTLRAGERRRLSLAFVRPEELEHGNVPAPESDELDRRFERTIERWRDWSSRARMEGPEAAGALRSAIILKGLTNQRSGAIAAAATTSLPEVPGGERNWDYRYSWVRDSVFSVDSLIELGYAQEADAFRRFVQRSSAGHSDELCVLYGVAGERRIPEQEIELAGYGDARPVRIGNAAVEQLQLDLLGELLDLSWRWRRRGEQPSDDLWRFLHDLVETAVERWREPDQGIWEWRGEPRQFVHSKVMCWAAVDRGLKLAESSLRKAPERRWRRARDEIRAAIEEHGYDAERGVFLQALDRPELDAAVLLLPRVEFIAWDDERMRSTADVVREELSDDGLLRRYRTEDGLEGEEGAFIACSFWLAECYARQRRPEEAQVVFDRALATANDLGLFSEEHDPATGEMLGNFPQGLTHLSHISAAVGLRDMRAASVE